MDRRHDGPKMFSSALLGALILQIIPVTLVAAVVRVGPAVPFRTWWKNPCFGSPVLHLLFFLLVAIACSPFSMPYNLCTTFSMCLLIAWRRGKVRLAFGSCPDFLIRLMFLPNEIQFGRKHSAWEKKHHEGSLPVCFIRPIGCFRRYQSEG